MFWAGPRKINLENFRDIQLRPCGKSSYGLEIMEAFVNLYTVYMPNWNWLTKNGV